MSLVMMKAGTKEWPLSALDPEPLQSKLKQVLLSLNKENKDRVLPKPHLLKTARRTIPN